MAISGESTGLRGSGGPGPADDWPAQAADFVERTIGTVRDKVVVPVEKVARLAVYGVLAAVVGVVAIVLVAVGAVRLLNALLPGDVWVAHAVVGGIFVLAGVFLWTRRSASPQRR